MIVHAYHRSHYGCKGTSLFPHCQRKSNLFVNFPAFAPNWFTYKMQKTGKYVYKESIKERLSIGYFQPLLYMSVLSGVLLCSLSRLSTFVL